MRSTLKMFLQAMLSLDYSSNTGMNKLKHDIINERETTID
jgi:hypothetical protein